MKEDEQPLKISPQISSRKTRFAVRKKAAVIHAKIEKPKKYAKI